MALALAQPKSEIISENEFIFYKVGDKIMNCGLNINSQYSKENMGVGLKCSDIKPAEKENVEQLFKNLMVPSGLVYIKYAHKTNKESFKTKMIEDDEEINDDIYDRLLELVNADSKSNTLVKRQNTTTRKKIKNIGGNGKRTYKTRKNTNKVA